METKVFQLGSSEIILKFSFKNLIKLVKSAQHMSANLRSRLSNFACAPARTHGSGIW